MKKNGFLLPFFLIGVCCSCDSGCNLDDAMPANGSESSGDPRMN